MRAEVLAYANSAYLDIPSAVQSTNLSRLFVAIYKVRTSEILRSPLQLLGMHANSLI